MHGQNQTRSRCESGRHALRINLKRRGLGIGENGQSETGRDAVERRDKRVSRQNYFVAWSDIKGAEGGEERGGAR